MVMIRTDGSLVSDSLTAATSGHKPTMRNADFFFAAHTGKKSTMPGQNIVFSSTPSPSYLAVLNRPVCAVGVTILQSYAQGLSSVSCSTHIWRHRAGETVSQLSICVQLVCYAYMPPSLNLSYSGFS